MATGYALTGTGGILDGRYLLEETLAVGGMGAVYRAHDPHLDRPVAIKMLHPYFAAGVQLERFLQEGRTLAALSHPNLVAVYDAGMARGTPYLVMEYIEGDSLVSLIESRGPLSPEQGVPLARQICLGLACAHARGVVHRDIKPQNILVTPGGRVKIVDFGIARTAGSTEVTAPGLVMGTAQYLAPEVAAGSPATARSDLYALGVVLFRTFTGRLPFDGEDPIAVAVLHRSAPVPKPSSLRPGIPPALEALLLRLLEKDPACRYPSADAVLTALADPACLGHPPARAAAQPSAGSVVPGIGRHPGTVPPPAGAPAQRRLPRITDLVMLAVGLISIILILWQLGAA